MKAPLLTLPNPFATANITNEKMPGKALAKKMLMFIMATVLTMVHVFGQAPTISTSGTPVALTANAGTASASTSFNISGIDLVGDITVTAPAGFNVSPDNATWTTQASPSYTITPVSGVIASTPVYIQLDAADMANTYTGSIALTGGTATEVDVAIPTSTVNPVVTVVSITPVSNRFRRPISNVYTNDTTVNYAVTFASALATSPSIGDFALTGAATGTINSITSDDDITF